MWPTLASNLHKPSWFSQLSNLVHMNDLLGVKGISQRNCALVTSTNTYMNKCIVRGKLLRILQILLPHIFYDSLELGLLCGD